MPLRRVLALLGVLGVMAGVMPARAQGVHEYDLKAEFVRRFTLFIEWPQDALEPDAPFVIGIIGDSPLLPALAARLHDAMVKGRPAELRVINDLDEAEACQVLVIGAQDKGGLERILERTRGHPVLTVSDCPGCARQGVMINFVLEEDRVRFEINEEAVGKSRLVVSSRLLRVARLVEDRAS